MSEDHASKMKLEAGDLRTAEQAISGCEHCDPRADTPFYWVLDSTVGSPGASYTMPVRATCPVCSAGLLGDTLVLWT